ncbi:MAG: hypothetical protein ON057_000661 [Glomeribacter sp. 1016415]|nr:hypothetical protein [Glomeribacter sp. 1016415]
MLNSTPLSPIFNAATSVSQHRASQGTADWGISSASGDKSPFGLVLEVLNQLRANQQQFVQASKEKVEASKKNLTANDVVSQQEQMKLSRAEKALSEYEAAWNKVMQLIQQLNTRILDAIR